MMKWKGCGWNRFWPNLRQCPGIFAEGKHEKLQTGQPVTVSRFEPGTPRTRMSVNYSIAAFGIFIIETYMGYEPLGKPDCHWLTPRMTSYDGLGKYDHHR